MKKSKKFLSVFLAFCMVMGILPLSALAAGITELTIGSMTVTEDGSIVVTDSDGKTISNEYLNVYYNEGDFNEYVMEGNATPVLPTDPGSYMLYIEVNREYESWYEITNEDFNILYIAEGTNADTSGTCNENITWTLTDYTTLTISGTGEMENYDAYDSFAPWDIWKNSVTSVVIEDGVTSIGDGAFYRCANMTSVTIPDSVTSIGNFAFEFCCRLTGITIPDDVTSIGHAAFSYCGNLTGITIPDGVTSIGDYAFDSCCSLASITIPDSVTSIGKLAFQCCESLTSVIIPDNVTSIGYGAFNICYNLTSITIPDSVTSIGELAFQRCESLTSVIIPGNVTTIGGYAFSNCNSLQAISVDEGNQYYTSIDGVLFNSERTKLVCYPSGRTETAYTIPNSVTAIDGNAFQGCDSLTSVTIPDSVTSIGDDAFSDCRNLTSITIPDGVTSIGEAVFHSCKSLISVTIPDSVTSIGDRAFSGCNRLTNITIPDGVTSIGDLAFDFCVDLTSITIPDGVTSIGECAFYHCRSLTSITIPDGVTSIGQGTFNYCNSLTSITIPNSVTSIGEEAFYYCKSLTSVYYDGTLEQWAGVTIGEDNDPLLNAELVLSGGKEVVTVSGVSVADKTYDGEPAVMTGTPVATLNGETVEAKFDVYYISNDTSVYLIDNDTKVIEGVQLPSEVGEYTLYVNISPEDENYIGASNLTFTISEADDPNEENPDEGVTPSTPTTPTTPTTPSTPSTSTTVTVPVPEEPEDGGETGDETGDDVTANVEIEATISGSTADVTVSEEEISSAITGETAGDETTGGETAAQQPSGVVIDLSNLGMSITSIQLAVDTIQTIVDTFKAALDEAGITETDVPALTAKLTTGTITFDSAALTAIVEQSGNRKVQFRLNLDDEKGTSYLSGDQKEAVKDKEIHAGVDVYAFDENGRIGDFRGGNVRMSIPFEVPEGYKADGFSVWHVPEDGSAPEKHETTHENGKLHWETGHWSDFIIVYDEADADEAVYPDENGGTAHASAVKVVVDDGEAVDMYAYALKDEEGNSSNYFKLRDIAALLNGTAAQFEVDFDGSVVVENGKPYTVVGNELVKTFAGDHPYTAIDVDTKVDGVVTDIAAFCLHLENGDGYNYYQLRDVGRVLGFNVAWDDDAKVIVIQTGKPYTGIL